MQLALYFDVLLDNSRRAAAADRASSNQYMPAGSSPWRGLPRLRHLVHQPFAGGVFAVFQLQRISRGAQLCRQPERQAHRHGAAVALERNDRPAERGCSTCCSMAVSKASLCAATTQLGSAAASRNSGGTGVARDATAARDRRRRHTPYTRPRRRIGRVPGRATLLQAGAASGLVIAVQSALFDGGEFGAGFRHGWPSLDGRPGCAGTLAGISKRRSTAS